MTINRACVMTTLLLVLLVGVARAAEENPRVISVSGQGEISVDPDRASVSLAVEARHLNLEQARRRVNQTVDRFLDFSDGLGIERRRISTSGVTVRPEYDWGNQRERRLVAYYVSRQLIVDLRDLEKLGRLIEGAVDVGVNQVSDPRLDASDRAAHQREALANAAQDARRNAETLGGALGAKVGPLRSVSALQSGVQPPPMPCILSMRAEAAGSRTAETYETGQIKFTARVTAEFDLINP